MTLKALHRRLGNIAVVASFVGGMAMPIGLLAQKPYAVQTQWKVGGEGGWDYLTVDAKARRLYVTHGTRVEVLDLNSGKPVGYIGSLKGTHGVALDDAGRLGYISDGTANAVVVFDRMTLKIIATIPAGTNPDGIAFEPTTKTVWAFNGRSHDVSVIDATQQKLIATITLPGKPEFPVADGSGTVFVNVEDKNAIVRLDAVSKKITATWPLSCDSPSGLAIDRTGHRLFSVCDGKKMAVTDANSGRSLANPVIGDSPDATAYDALHKIAFSSNGDGTLTVVDASVKGYPVLQNLTTQRGARTMALDESTGQIYLVTAELGARPAATTENPHPRPAVIPESFTVLVVGRE